MAKDPAFLFYSQDFFVATAYWSNEQVGKYIRLLIAQHQYGRLSADMVDTISQGDSIVSSKFEKDENGNFFNEKLELVIEQRKKFTESRRNNLKKKKDHKEQHMNSHMDKHMVSHMENEIENENTNEFVFQDKGVKGEKDSLTQLEISNTIEFIDRAIFRAINEADVKRYWEAFKIYSEGKAYNSHADKVQHFRNWIKSQKHETAKRIDTARPGTKLSAI